jgi:hypothetical protein
MKFMVPFCIALPYHSSLTIFMFHVLYYGLIVYPVIKCAHSLWPKLPPKNSSFTMEKGWLECMACFIVLNNLYTKHAHHAWLCEWMLTVTIDSDAWSTESWRLQPVSDMNINRIYEAPKSINTHDSDASHSFK